MQDFGKDHRHDIRSHRQEKINKKRSQSASFFCILILIYNSMRIKRYEEFECANEGIKSSISIIGMLIGLGIGSPAKLWANKEKIEQSIDSKEEQVLKIVDSLEKEDPRDTIFGKALPISRLAKEIERQNQSSNSSFNIEDVVVTMRKNYFPIKIEFIFPNRGKQIPMPAIEYKLDDKVMFMLSKNFDTYMYGIGINF